LVQVWPLEQTVPQPPQLFESVVVSEQPPPQHVVLLEQTVPQEPQLFESFCVSEHVPAQLVGALLGHVHLPLEHSRLLPHATEQEPQFDLLLLRSTQLLPHIV
jgi:hypothetical protein